MLTVDTIVGNGNTKVSFPAGIDVGGEGLITPDDYRTSRGQLDPRNNVGIAGFATQQSAFYLIRDSFGDGVGASDYKKSTGWMTMRSLMNANDRGVGNERGYGYHTNLNWNTAVDSGFFSHTGTIVDEGVVRTRLQLNVGQTLTCRGVAADYIDLQVIGAGTTTATVEARRNGVLYRTITIGNTPVLATTFTGAKVRDDNVLTKETDEITFTVTEGTVKVRGVLAWRTAGFAPAAFLATRGGTTYHHYISSEALDEIAYDCTFARPPGNQVVVGLGLGTNSIFNPGEFDTPSEMLADVELIRIGLVARIPGVKFVIQVPANRGNNWPSICPKPPAEGGGFYTWEEYRDAILAYAYARGMGIVRHDLSVLGTRNDAYFVGDGLHLNNAGHLVDAMNWCETLGIPFNDSYKPAAVTYSLPAELSAAIAAGGAGSEGVWTPVLHTANGDATAYGQRQGSWVRDAQGWVTATFTVVGTWAGATPPAGAGSEVQVKGLPFTPQANKDGSGWIGYIMNAPLPAGTAQVGAAITTAGDINIVCTMTAGGPFQYIGANTIPDAPGITICGGVRFKPN